MVHVRDIKRREWPRRPKKNTVVTARMHHDLAISETYCIRGTIPGVVGGKEHKGHELECNRKTTVQDYNPCATPTCVVCNGRWIVMHTGK